MKKTLLSSALTGTAGALALTLVLGAGPAFAGDNTAEAGDDQIAVQDVLNDNGNNRENDNSTNVDDSLNNNDVNSHNGDSTNVDDSLNGNRINSDDNKLEADLENIGNDYSKAFQDNSTSIEDVAVLVSSQNLVGIAAKSVGGGFVFMDDVKTGDVDYDGAYDGAAGSMNASANTGLSSNAQAATAILANGDFHID